MRRWTRPLCLTLLMIALSAQVPVWAQNNEECKELSCQLAKQLYCSIGDLLGGNIGLLLGLVLVFMGLWSLVQGAKMIAALPIIIMGSLITALPTLIESFFGGLGGLLAEKGISSATFKPPVCEGFKVTASTGDYTDSGTYVPGVSKLNGFCEQLSCSTAPTTVDELNNGLNN